MTETADITAKDSLPVTDHAPMAWRPVLVVAAVVAAIHLPVATRFGWYGDEFYYVICGRHPAWGYIDQPPLTPILARLAAALPGDGGLLPLRLLAIAMQVGCVVLGAMLAAEIGGRRRAQVISAAALGASPVC
jgi:4-amino-4-deoxy-L-arabinose transferase-like glycosyltransferase